MLPKLTPRRNYWAKILTCWIPIKIYRKFLRGVFQMGVTEFLRRRRAERTATFDYDLSVVAIMKDEGPYLKEWLDFHILVGVQHFYLYDNGSTDDTFKVIAPYIERGIVDRIDLPGFRMQTAAYTDAINRFGNKTRWMAVVDIDEFVVPTATDTILEQLRSLPRNFGALVLTWVMYGSSGHVKKPNGLVTENFKYRGDRTRESGCKTIVNPRFVTRWHSAHINEFAGFIVDENGRKLGRINQTWNPPSFDKIRCNHYITKSYDEYKERRSRRSAGGGIVKWSPERFAQLDTNDVYDNSMDRFIPELKKMMKQK